MSMERLSRPPSNDMVSDAQNLSRGAQRCWTSRSLFLPSAQSKGLANEHSEGLLRCEPNVNRMCDNLLYVGGSILLPLCTTSDVVTPNLYVWGLGLVSVVPGGSRLLVLRTGETTSLFYLQWSHREAVHTGGLSKLLSKAS